MIEKIMRKLGYEKLKDIEILYTFIENPPSERKMDYKKKYFIENGKFQEDIVLCGKCLIDGYTSYLIAQEIGKKYVKVRRVSNEFNNKRNKTIKF